MSAWTRGHRAAATVAALLVAGALGACSAGSAGAGDGASASGAPHSAEAPTSTPQGGDGATPTDACGLVTLEQLEAAFGHPYLPGEPAHLEVSGADQCTWTNADPDTAQLVSLTVAEGPHAVEVLQANRALIEAPRDLDLGDDAFGDGPSIWVRDGDRTYAFLAVAATDPLTIEHLEDLARTVVEGG